MCIVRWLVIDIELLIYIQLVIIKFRLTIIDFKLTIYNVNIWLVITMNIELVNREGVAFSLVDNIKMARLRWLRWVDKVWCFIETLFMFITMLIFIGLDWLVVIGIYRLV